MDSASFVESVAALQFDNVFNPYRDTCSEFDLPGAPKLRRHNLENVLNAAISNGVDSIWLGRDLGYRGGRRTGLALTDEAHLATHSEMFGGVKLCRSTTGVAIAERTATTIWNAIVSVKRPIFLWNVFPLHPYAEGAPMTNRTHKSFERKASQELMLWLIEVLAPKHVVAIGNDAQKAMRDSGVAFIGVRHPSYGGQRDFYSGIDALYDTHLVANITDQLKLNFDG